jgi:nickel transport protein
MAIKGKRRKYVRYAWPGVLALFFNLVPAAHAHKVYVFAWAEGDIIHTESYFGGKKSAVGGLIKVFDPEGKELLEGKTDEKGEFSFRLPKRTDLKIVLEASMGHRAEYLLKAEEIPGPLKRNGPAAENKKTAVPTPRAAAPDIEQIRGVVEEALDARLKPVLRTLARVQEERGPGVTEVMGGIGYVLGLMGLIAYFKARKKDRS